MALATRCPNCHALFRVAAEQLKTHSGMVRCGSCRHVFNAIECLDYLDPQHPAAADTQPRRETDSVAQLAFQSLAARSSVSGNTSPPAPARPAPTRPQTAATSAQVLSRPAGAAASAQGLATEPRHGEVRSRVARAPMRTIHEFAPVEESQGMGPLTVMGPITEGPNARSAPSFDQFFPPHATTGEASRARDEPVQREAALVQAEQDGSEPNFLRTRHVEPMSRGSRIAFGVASGLLSLTLAVEIVVFFRTSLIVHFPESRPLMNALCVPLGCTAQWPMRPEFLAVVSSELQAVPGTDGMELDALIRNRAAFPMALPAIELTVTDSRNQPVARKVFLPADYQKTRPEATDPASDNIPAESDLPVRILFELPGAGASGFIAYPFYP